MNLFINTVQIVGGILSPIILVLILKFVFEIIVESKAESRARHERAIEEAKKQPPFDDEAEFYKVPNPTMIGVKLFKSGVVVWKGAIDKEKYNT